VEVPALSGCFSPGETLAEAFTNIREASELHVESLRDEGQEIPADKGIVIGGVEVSVTPSGPPAQQSALSKETFNSQRSALSGQ
jgi:predicted RNase H-like HicB family nuclease